MAAMSAIEQPAARSGRITCWCGAESTSALSAMKWTPQKTMNSASGCRATCPARLSESPGGPEEGRPGPRRGAGGRDAAIHLPGVESDVAFGQRLPLGEARVFVLRQDGQEGRHTQGRRRWPLCEKF